MTSWSKTNPAWILCNTKTISNVACFTHFWVSLNLFRWTEIYHCGILCTAISPNSNWCYLTPYKYDANGIEADKFRLVHPLLHGECIAIFLMITCFFYTKAFDQRTCMALPQWWMLTVNIYVSYVCTQKYQSPQKGRHHWEHKVQVEPWSTSASQLMIKNYQPHVVFLFWIFVSCFLKTKLLWI